MIYKLHRNSPTSPAERVAYEGIENARKHAVSIVKKGKTKDVYILDSNKVLAGRVFKTGDDYFYRDYKKAIVRVIKKDGKTVAYR